MLGQRDRSHGPGPPTDASTCSDSCSSSGLEEKVADYGDHRDPQAAIAWLRKFVDGAKIAGELYGRALVVIAAEQHASRLVVPASQRTPATSWSSHKDHVAKALRKLCGPAVPEHAP
ncbi:hypothetical protein [Paraconexibacter algicola]|uniref:hypothetical protein n=1 Tax=Paraconexibacter algicola TaxID=2133960 RepID=UPI0011B24AFE|nr:hypothetical protein [Paraconexibacter algicola]